MDESIKSRPTFISLMFKKKNKSISKYVDVIIQHEINFKIQDVTEVLSNIIMT